MKAPDFSGAISAAAMVAAIPAIAETTAAIALFSAILSSGLTLLALVLRVVNIVRRVREGKLTPDKAAEEVEKLKERLKK